MQSPATLCARCTIPYNMLKENAAAVRTLWQRCMVFKRAAGALWARRVRAVKTLCIYVFGGGVCNTLNNNTSIHKMF